MKYLKIKNIIILLFVSNMLMGCVTLQQPLPGSLWGNWAFVQTGTIINGSNEKLINYRNLCSTKADRLHFSSDNKMSLRWYDENCTINHYLIGSYQVEGNTLKVNLENSNPYQNSPLPPITAYRIIQINATTLKLEEIPDENRRQRHQGRRSGPEVMVFVFLKAE